MKDIRKTIKNDLEYLRQVSEEVNFKNDNYEEWVKQLKKYCTEFKLFALAPVQIGIPKRMIYFKNTTEDMDRNADANYDENEILINPKLISMKGKAKYLERCASCLDYGAELVRPYMVEVEYYDVHGNINHAIYTGLKATIFCHEYDHLDGILHIDRSDNLIKLTWEEAKAYRLKYPYTVISKDGEYIDDLKQKKKTV